MATKKPTAPAKKPTATDDAAAPASPILPRADSSHASSEPAPNTQSAASNERTPAPNAQSVANEPASNAQSAVNEPASNAQLRASHRSLVEALQAELDDERLRQLAVRKQLEHQVTALQLTVDELRAELARATARSRELEAQLQQLRSSR